MKDKNIHLILAVFDGKDSAKAAAQQLPKHDRRIISAIIVEKDDDEKVTFENIGRTPRRGAVEGVILGGVVGLLSGGAGLALGALGGIIGHHSGKKKQAIKEMANQLGQVAGSLGPDSSAIIAVVKDEPKLKSFAIVQEMGGDIFEAVISQEASEQMDAQADEAYATLLTALAEKTGGEVKTGVPYPRIFVVVNPASGKPEPVLHTLNSVFSQYGVKWELSITQKYGDATEFARRAAESGDFDLVVGYGGDGTQHEIANGVIGTGVTMGLLPGGTGNGFGTELGVPKDLKTAAELLCTSYNVQKIDIAQYGEDVYFIQRLFTGIEPEEQTSRADKDKYGTFAYFMRDVNRYKGGEMKDIPYRLTVDGQVVEIQGYKCYVVNSGMAGTGLSIGKNFKIDDGYLDVFMLSSDRASTEAALNRFLGLTNEKASMYYWRGQKIMIDAEPDQAVWTDGEYTGRTPVTIKVLPKALTVAVP